MSRHKTLLALVAEAICLASLTCAVIGERYCLSCADSQFAYLIDIPYGAYAQWFVVLFIAAAVACGVVIAVATKQEGGGNTKPRIRVAAIFAFAMCVALLVGISVSIPQIVSLRGELERVQAMMPDDYVADRHFQEITLDELEALLDEQADNGADEIVYLGRERCSECDVFEDELTQALLEDNSREKIKTYYVSEDSNSPRKGEVHNLIDDVGVQSIPCMFVMRGGKVIYKWNDPLAGIDQIRTYLNTGQLPTATVGAD